METVNSLRLLELTVNRTDFLDFEQSAGPARRSLATEVEWRQIDGGKRLLFRGHASTTEQEYDVYGGSFPGWIETMAAGSFKRTINNNADVVFLINHEGMALAGTRAGTLGLEEDKIGLADEARLNPKVSAVSDLYELNSDGMMVEQSFAFKVVRDAWFNEDGDPADQNTGTHRRILEVNMNRGDVSAVNFGANPNTSGGFRSDMALAELRDGRLPTEDALARLAGAFLEERMVAPGDMMLEHIQAIETAAANLRNLLNSNNVSKTPAVSSDELLLQNSASEPDHLLAAYSALWELRRDPAA